MAASAVCSPQNGWALARCAAKGIRGAMEDVSVTSELIAVLDGHNGRECAEFIASRLPTLAQLPQSDWPAAFAELDDQFREQRQPSGSTCVAAILHSSCVEIANLGDSRAVLVRSGRVLQQTTDHKPDSASECERILRCGGRVEKCKEGPARVGGVAVSRAFGTYVGPLAKTVLKDAALPHSSHLISCSPDLYTWEAETGDVLVLACDGVWDVLSVEDVAGLKGDVRQIAQAICTQALQSSTDNVHASLQSWGALLNLTSRLHRPGLVQALIIRASTQPRVRNSLPSVPHWNMAKRSLESWRGCRPT
eukprot:TRINITY_DN105571_c0_g1_i1.p1 TRINITY_DN105571_c0_g1~~TRINITY_DN105571_c0_g1_i1.p1  ORF type:complete len:307 (+),score=38.75 TRINITY_DN105571_c0_g1_i1:35-955(+)